MSALRTWEAAELGRLLYTHRLDPALAAAALGFGEAQVRTLCGGHVGAGDIPPERHEHVALMLNVLIRIELRCGHDSVAVAAALERPLDLLGGSSIAERLRAAPDLAGLRLLREAAGAIPVTKIKMWRVADTYS